MKGKDAYRFYCLLDERLRERDMTAEQLHEISGVAREAIGRLRRNTFEAVADRTVARICGALGITVGELFVVLPEDIWLPIRLTREVTIHFGSRTWNEPQPAERGMAPMMGRQYIGVWDSRASNLISEYLTKFHVGINVRFQEHITGPGRGIDPAVRKSVQEIFKRGNHIILGSPIANQFTEEVVSYAYQVAPYDPKMRARFPYAFEWNSWRQVPSSFGRRGTKKRFGIVEVPSNRIVAPQTAAAVGEDGTDGALIVVYRVFCPPANRTMGEHENIVMCLMGDTGLGTLAAALLATDPSGAAGLFPDARAQPRMRALKCEYRRPPGDPLIDNREVKTFELIPEREVTGTVVKPPRRRLIGSKARARD